jgi:hypothetical protein
MEQRYSRAIHVVRWIFENTSVTLYGTSNYGDNGKRYNWILVEWINHNEERNTYPGKIPGFFIM